MNDPSLIPRAIDETAELCKASIHITSISITLHSYSNNVTYVPLKVQHVSSKLQRALLGTFLPFAAMLFTTVRTAWQTRIVNCRSK